MKNIKTVYTINLLAFAVSFAALPIVMLQNVFGSFASLMMAAEGSHLGIKGVLPYIIIVFIPQSVFFYTFFKIKKAADGITANSPDKLQVIRSYKTSKVLAVISVFLIMAYTVSFLPIFLWGV